MSKYIDKDAFVKSIKPIASKMSFGIQSDIANAIVSAPSIDIVRCKECKHWHSGNCWGIPFSGDDASYIETESGDFCSYGEAKEK